MRQFLSRNLNFVLLGTALLLFFSCLLSIANHCDYRDSKHQTNVEKPCTGPDCEIPFPATENGSSLILPSFIGATLFSLVFNKRFAKGATVAACAMLLGGCRTSPIRWEAMVPASQADLDTVKADTDQDRENLKGAVDSLGNAVAAIRDDLSRAQIDVTNTNSALGDVKKAQESINGHLSQVESRPPSGGLPGALINALGVNLPPWLDWLLTLFTGGAATAGVVNTRRDSSRKKALAEVEAKAKTKTTQ